MLYYVRPLSTTNGTLDSEQEGERHDYEHEVIRQWEASQNM